VAIWEDSIVTTSDRAFPAELFDRQDESSDELFYRSPRMVTHIDDATIDALRQFYLEQLSADVDVLDLMSSCVSHLPGELQLGRVAGLGMNAEELAANSRLSDWRVHDLNREPELPYPDACFDAVLNAVSIQYLIDPVTVFTSIQRVLRPGGISIVAMSHRCFPTKAIRAFHNSSGSQRMAFVGRCGELAGFDEVRQFDRSPLGADPLWLVVATKAARGNH
jgi:SAM-dependent methyltransferase